jgi:hypothetical protein
VYLFFCDLLGARAQWRHSGADGVLSLCERFNAVLAKTLLLAEVLHDLQDGLVESDSAAFIFRTRYSAVHFATSLYQKVFIGTSRVGIQRLFWLRGILRPYDSAEPLRASHPLSHHAPAVARFSYSLPLLHAIAAEKSGFKGMRLLVHESLVQMDDRLAKRIGQHASRFFRRLKWSGYPAQADCYQDALWMLAEMDFNPADFRTKLMLRLKWAAKDQEEFLQAAATQVVFNEAFAMAHSAGNEDA